MTPAELCKEIYGVEPARVVLEAEIMLSTSGEFISVCDKGRWRTVKLTYHKFWRGDTYYALNCALVDGTFYYSQVVEVTT